MSRWRRVILEKRSSLECQLRKVFGDRIVDAIYTPLGKGDAHKGRCE